MAKYPIFLELSGRRVVVVGGGQVAKRKAKALLDAEGDVTVVSERIKWPPADKCRGKNIKFIQSSYKKEHLKDATLVIAATDNPTENERIYKDCRDLSILCNVVDRPKLCDFFMAATIKRGNLQIAISTDGKCPAYARHIRKRLEGIFTKKHGEFLAELEKLRKQLIKDVADPDERKAILGRLVDDESFEHFSKNSPDKWRAYAEVIIEGR